jgi:heme/copper-type cytochrome/quinol oxidase subunit 2
MAFSTAGTAGALPNMQWWMWLLVIGALIVIVLLVVGGIAAYNRNRQTTATVEREVTVERPATY